MIKVRKFNIVLNKNTTFDYQCFSINQHIGLRISEILNIEPSNITINKNNIEIRFIEEKKQRERTVIVVDKKAISVLKKHLKYDKLWSIKKYYMFDRYIKCIAKIVFKDETIKIYKINTKDSKYCTVLKCDAISSHAFRRFAIQRNIVRYGIDVARTFSGHSDYQIIVKHYAGFMDKQDLLNKLLK